MNLSKRSPWVIGYQAAEIDLANWLEGCYTVCIIARYVAVIGD